MQSSRKYHFLVLSCANTLSDDSSESLGSDSVVKSSALPLSSTIVNATTSCPTVLWNAASEEYGTFWVATFTSGTNINKSYIKFSRIGKTGVLVGETVTAAEGLRIEGLTGSWKDNIYALAWTSYQDGNKEIFYSALNNDGTKILNQDGGIIRITATSAASVKPALVMVPGNEFGIAWQENASWYDIYFTRINLQGKKLSGDVKITDSAHDYTDPQVTWNGSSYCVAFSVLASQKQCNFRHVSAAHRLFEFLVPISPTAQDRYRIRRFLVR